MDDAIKREEEQEKIYALMYLKHLKNIRSLKNILEDLKSEFRQETIKFSRQGINTKIVRKTVKNLLQEEKQNSKIDKTNKLRKTKILNDALLEQNEVYPV